MRAYFLTQAETCGLGGIPKRDGRDTIFKFKPSPHPSRPVQDNKTIPPAACTGCCEAMRYPKDDPSKPEVPRNCVRATDRSSNWSCRPVRTATACTCRDGRLTSRGRQLAFPCNPFKGFRRAFDPILAVVVFRWELTDDLVGAAGSRTRDVARGEIDGRANGKLVFQRPLLLACRQEPLGPAARAGVSLINGTSIACCALP